MRRAAAVALSALVLSGCSSGGHAPSGTSWRTTFQSKADRICTTAQQQVLRTKATMRVPLYPASFPAPVVSRYLTQTSSIGSRALAQVRALPVPADGKAERDAGLRPLEQQVRLAADAAAAAAQADGRAYARVAGGTVQEAPATLVPRSCLGLSLGTGAHA